ADQLFALAARAGAQDSPDMRLVEGQLLSGDARHTEAEEIFGDVAAQNVKVAPRALYLLIQSLNTRGAPVPEALLAQAKSTAWLLRQDSAGPPLLLETVRADAGANNLDAALRTIAEEIRITPDRAQMYRLVAAELVAQADPTAVSPADYSAAVLTNLRALPEDISGDVARRAAAAALLDLALPDTALAVLTPAMARRAPDVLLLAARAHLASGRAHVALQLAADLGSEARELRAEALAQLGQHQAAAQLYETGAERAVPEPLALAAGHWDALTTSEDEIRRGIGEFMRADRPDAPDPSTVFGTRAPLPDRPSLEQTRLLLEQNRATRETVEGILNDVPPSLVVPERTN
ncbi:MAG: hypothetical protein AAFQ51_16110, partial [Pseudomonadota bacterium]